MRVMSDVLTLVLFVSVTDDGLAIRRRWRRRLLCLHTGRS